MKRNQAEFKLSCAVADYLRIVLPDDVVWSHFPAGELRTQKTGGRLKRMGLRPGVPDYFIAIDGRVLWIELKAGNAPLSDAQKLTFPALHRAGQQLAICTSIDEVEEALIRWGVPVRTQTYNVRAAANLFQGK